VAIKRAGSTTGAHPANMVLLDLTGKSWGALNPSSDTKTHLGLYRAFGEIGACAHPFPIRDGLGAGEAADPCLGTTHADYFYGEVPCTEVISDSRIARDYETRPEP